MKRPKDKCRTFKMLGYFIMACLDQVKDSFQILLLPNIIFRKRTPFDESHDEDLFGALEKFESLSFKSHSPKSNDLS
jgi:hypothetical protein